MRAFEIQTYTGGKWKIDAIFDDREFAVFEARRMDESHRYSGVRVVEETFDEETQQSIARTIFRGGRVGVEVSRASSPPPSPRRRAGARRGNGSGRARGAAKGAARGPNSNAVLLIILSLIVVGGIAALAALQLFLPQYL